jgi:hypothetical protein
MVPPGKTEVCLNKVWKNFRANLHWAQRIFEIVFKEKKRVVAKK